ncbi:hypothetical protein G6F47_003666 [Rhizopus delemar]|uniref:Endonuclease III homolog n=1 Tax=Rhizopus delemar (strain RA 99-880 / ATCC MYA-4621 / FGSC 9543 / NRRL 43880) TaxID=246409 RepID=I1C027_RHIO9|nr:hypothetical protein RO3G_06512 [Rhizopus delemar RA 99-880]KAG1053266.1 hypothetical protein G6F43_004640 [Rhizopus delemar]KAG1620348.1 hypothetical protein G6F45_011541 [Rhizopus arrhizus]KAG1579261.1 hypothetical protein G6F48_011292 [Rhizopus delemar]KAG1601457.1 hypothetical protein G6F47_003666 [Rhizopus delemar]|eukprot:EIE81807.1 hypothetical protein RO3G_06512 [Rhizopus delemar RA 99-880]
MSLRRSTRKTVQTTTSLPESIEKKAIKRIATTKKPVSAKKVKYEVKQDPGFSIPPNWEIVYNKLEAFRDIEEAPVDTMGCERLAQTTAPPKIQRFQTLVALMLSAQTKDTVTSATMIKLQNELPAGLNLESILNVDVTTLDQLIRSVGFHSKKAVYIKKTAEILRDQYDGDIPDTIEGLTSLPGVGPKMGYLTLQVAWNKNLGIGVDVHVHRITNRLGWVSTKTPEETRESLQSWLPKDKWKKINPILVGYGQIVCLPRNPRCDVCPVSEYCPSSEIKKIMKKKTQIKKEGDKIKVEQTKEETTESIYFKKEFDDRPFEDDY